MIHYEIGASWLGKHNITRPEIGPATPLTLNLYLLPKFSPKLRDEQDMIFIFDHNLTFRYQNFRFPLDLLAHIIWIRVSNKTLYTNHH